MADRWWERRTVYAAVAILAAVPLLWPRIPPLLDLPSHMASYHVALSLARSPLLQRYFDFHWALIGNLGVDLLIMPLGRLVGVELGTKLIVIMIPIATAIGFLLVARQGHGRLPATALAAVPLAYNYPLLFGFVNYNLSLAIALPAFAWWLALSDGGRWRTRALAFAAIAAAVWLAHAIGWAMLCVLCGASSLQRRIAAGERLHLVLLHTALDCLPLLTPLLLIIAAPSSGRLAANGFFEPFTIAKWLATVFRDRWLVFDLACAAAVGVLLCATIVRVGGLRWQPRLAWPAAALFILFLLAPNSINGSYFVSARIAPYVLAMAVLAIDARALAPARQGLLAMATALFLVIRIVGHTASFWLYDQAYTRNLAALDHIPPGSATLTFARIPCKSGLDNWYNPRLYHLPGMAVVRRDAFVNATWAISGLQLLTVHFPQAGPYQTDPSEMVYTTPCSDEAATSLSTAMTQAPLAAFDQLWLLDVPRPFWPRDRRFRLLWSTDESAVFAIARPLTASAK